MTQLVERVVPVLWSFVKVSYSLLSRGTAVSPKIPSLWLYISGYFHCCVRQWMSHFRALFVIFLCWEKKHRLWNWNYSLQTHINTHVTFHDILPVHLLKCQRWTVPTSSIIPRALTTELYMSLHRLCEHKAPPMNLTGRQSRLFQ